MADSMDLDKLEQVVEAAREAERILNGLSDRWSWTPKETLPVLDAADIDVIRGCLASLRDSLDAYDREEANG